MKFAFLIMGDFNIEADRASIHDGTARIVGVASIGEAKEEALRLKHEGVGCIELCSAFGEDGARAVIEATGNRLPIGYVMHFPEQDEVYHKSKRAF